MQIDSIRIEHVAMPLLSPWRTAYGEDAAIESVLVQLRSRNTVAWGESSPLAAPCYSPEWAGGVFACVRDWLGPALLGQEISSGVQLQSLLSHIKGNPFAKAALDTAWWVLDATQRRIPLHQLVGGSTSSVSVGADFGIMDSVPDLLGEIAVAVEQGFERIKLKFRPGWDIDMLAAVRDQFPSQTFHIDCNAAYRLCDLELFQRIDDFGLAMIEQPLQYDDVIDHAALQKEIRTPICLDESICSLDRARQAIERGSCRYINIKPGRVGGLTVAKEIHDLCRNNGISCWVGGMLESAVGSRICAALATVENFIYPADIFPSSRYYETDLADPPLELTPSENGPQVACSDEPGIGAAPNEARLEQWRVAACTLES